MNETSTAVGIRHTRLQQLTNFLQALQLQNEGLERQAAMMHTGFLRLHSLLVSEVANVQLPLAIPGNMRAIEPAPPAAPERSIPEVLPRQSISTVVVPANGAEDNKNGSGGKEEAKVGVAKKEAGLPKKKLPPIGQEKRVEKAETSQVRRSLRRTVPEKTRNAAGGYAASSTHGNVFGMNLRQRPRTTKESTKRQRQAKRTIRKTQTHTNVQASSVQPSETTKTQPANRTIQSHRRLTQTPRPTDLANRKLPYIRRSYRVHQRHKLQSLMARNLGTFWGEEPPPSIRQSRRLRERISLVKEQMRLKEQPLQCPRCLRAYSSSRCVRIHMKAVSCRRLKWKRCRQLLLNY